MKNKIEDYLQKVTKAGIKDRVVIENTLKTVVDYNEKFRQAKIDLRKAVNLEISTEEMIFINNHAFNLIQDINDISQSCKSFLALFKQLESDGDINSDYYGALKITDDKQYYFYCNLIYQILTFF